MKFTKNEAQLDFHFTIFGILIILIFVVFYPIWTHASTGIKYKMLTVFGAEAQLKITEANSQTTYDPEHLFSSNASQNRTNYKFTFKTNQGQQITTNADILDNAIHEKKAKETNFQRVQKFSIGDITVGKYVSWAPKIALPSTILVDLEVNWRILRNCFFALFALSCILIWRIFEYRKLKQKMKFD